MINNEQLHKFIKLLKETHFGLAETLTLRKRGGVGYVVETNEEDNIENTDKNETGDIASGVEEPNNIEPDLSSSGGADVPLDSPDITSDTNDSTMDVGGNSLGGLTGGGPGFTGDNSDSSNEKPKPEETEKQEKNLKDQLVEKIISGELMNAPSSDVFKAIRAGYLELPEIRSSWEEVKEKILKNGSQSSIDGLNRFEKYLTIKEETKDKEMKEVELTENQIVRLTASIAKKIIKEYTDAIDVSIEPNGGGGNKQPIPVEKGSRTFMAQRKLTISAQQAAFEFEAEIRSELSLKDPNEMPANAQKIYKDAMETMHMQVISATTKAIEAIKELPRIEKSNKN